MKITDTLTFFSLLLFFCNIGMIKTFFSPSLQLFISPSNWHEKIVFLYTEFCDVKVSSQSIVVGTISIFLA